MKTPRPSAAVEINKAEDPAWKAALENITARLVHSQAIYGDMVTNFSSMEKNFGTMSAKVTKDEIRKLKGDRP
jgi:hypothetical protein